MHVVMGATGHVGSVVARTLIDRHKPVLLVLRDPAGAAALKAAGAEAVRADVDDVPSLRAAFEKGQRAFLLNPPADIKTDTDAVERATVANILAALEGSGLEKVVAESTAAARPGERLGDSNTLWELEDGLRRQSIPAAINRAAYYMSNWDDQLDGIRKTGKLHTMFPADFELPMVAPADLGKAAADRLLSPLDDAGIRVVEGPRRYSSNDVARAFADALGRDVSVVVTPRSQWIAAYRKLGFSQAAAESYSRMTALALDEGVDPGPDSLRCDTTLESYVQHLVSR